MKNSQLLSKNFRFLVFLFILATLISMIYLYYHHNFYVNNKEAEITMTEIAEASLPHYMSDQPNAVDEDQGNRFGLGVDGFIFSEFMNNEAIFLFATPSLSHFCFPSSISLFASCSK